jgi:hypothetical protein
MSEDKSTVETHVESKEKTSLNVHIKEGKKEVESEMVQEQEQEQVQEQEQEPTAHQPEIIDLEDDPSMQEVFSLSRDILRRMKYLSREAHENQDFKQSWVNTLTKLKNDFDDQLGFLGVTIDE